MPLRARLDRKEQRERRKRLDRSERPHDARAERQAEADADQRAGGDRQPRIFFEGSHQPEQENRHRHREGRILRVHEHVAVVERTGGEQHERDQPGERPADAPADAPGDEQPDQSDGGADQPARLEQRERQRPWRQARPEVEAAAVVIEVDPRQRALIGKPEA